MSSASSITVADVDLQNDSRDVGHYDFHDESCALLISNQLPAVESQVPKLPATPVPKMQLFTLCLVRCAMMTYTLLGVPCLRLNQALGANWLYAAIPLHK